MCETGSIAASDAWSTDVLASDTSERQADRLRELDQDEVGSVSSRSQGHDGSEAGDVSADDMNQAGTTESVVIVECYSSCFVIHFTNFLQLL